MNQTRLFLGASAVLGLAAWVGLSLGQVPRPNAPRPATPPASLLTPAQERSANTVQDKSPFARGGLFTYRPSKTEQLFAWTLQPKLPANTIAARDYLVMVSMAATQSGEGYLASLQIVDQLIKRAGDRDRISVWLLSAGQATVALTDEFFSPKDESGAKKLKKALQKLHEAYPVGDTDLKDGLARALATFEVAENRQRILLFLGDGQSTHNVLDADGRFELARQMVEKKVAFFPVPLGMHLHAENLHGLANSTGGIVAEQLEHEARAEDVNAH